MTTLAYAASSPDGMCIHDWDAEVEQTTPEHGNRNFRLVMDAIANIHEVEHDLLMRRRALVCPVHGSKRRPTLCPVCALVECRVRFKSKL